MSNLGLDVFGVAQEAQVDVAKAREVLERKLDPRLIKTREAGGGVKLDYIGGHTVIRLLNEAFGYKWSFEIVRDEIVESQGKPVVEWKDRKRVPVLNADGSPKLEAQPPVVKVLGRLTVPGVGVKEQYGSKVLIGGASEQESTFKSASTDALKKCATMFGIGLELYDDEEDTATTASTPGAQPQSYSKPAYNNSGNSSYNKPAAPQPQAQASTQVKYDPADIEKMKELKAILGVTDNKQIDPFAREFFDDAKATYLSVTPSNIKAFNVFLSKKAQNA